MSQPSLPAGWAAQWDAQANRYLFVDTINNRSQWEQPTGPASAPASSSTPAAAQASAAAPPAAAVPAATSSNPRRRQYPTAQMAQAYAEGGAVPAIGGQGMGVGVGYGAGPGAGVGISTPGVSGGYSDLSQGGGQYPQQQQQGGMQQVPMNQGGQLFTPGMAGAGAGAGPATGGYFAPANPGYGDQKAFSVAGGVDPNQQQHQQQQGAGMMGNMVNQFNNMGMNGGNAGYGQQQGGQPQPMMGHQQQHQQPGQSHPLINLNLIGLQPSVPDLARDPPAPLLPPGACISNDPAANAHHSYQRSTINAIPTTASLLTKTKIPLALILTPYRSIKEGDVSGARSC